MALVGGIEVVRHNAREQQARCFNPRVEQIVAFGQIGALSLAADPIDVAKCLVGEHVRI